MFDHLPTITAPALGATGDDRALRCLLQEASEALLKAAVMLAGRRGEQLVLSIADDLGRCNVVKRRTVQALRELLDILELQNVHDESRVEAGFFAAIDPASPVVEEICLLSDQLRDAIEQAGLDHSSASQAAA